jgi:hypothetical protein
MRIARASYLSALLIFAIPLFPQRGLTEEGADDTTFTRQPLFRIPFQTDPGERRIKEVQLYMSTDQGQTWHPQAFVKPEERSFMFSAAKDGLYWFTVRTVDTDNRAYPLNMDGIKPGLKVVVDTQPPVITLRALPPREGQSGVEWDIQEENPDLASFVMDYRVQGSAEWSPLRPEPALTGQHYWKPMGAGTLEVRLHLRDRAGNEADGKATVQAVAENHVAAVPSTVVPSNPDRRLVNSKRFCLNYEVKGVGKSGLSTVELWYTQDSRSWQKHGEDRNHQPPYCVEVAKDGVYGFTLVVRSGVGLSVQPPQAGDPPQVWVEVDLIKPVVRIVNVNVGKGTDAGNLTIDWTATDKNLGRQPITLRYAEQATGPWTVIASNLDNTGRYVWHMPPDVPYQFFLKVEAIDRAGNVGTAETAKAVIADLSLPTPKIIGIEPDKKND